MSSTMCSFKSSIVLCSLAIFQKFDLVLDITQFFFELFDFSLFLFDFVQ